MRPTVLFVPQNDSHAETSVLLARAIQARGLGSTVLDMDGVFHQGTGSILGDMPRIASDLVSDRPFYRLPARHQVRLVSAARSRVSRWLDGVDAVVSFNDGALQRAVFAEASRRGVPVDLVLDGMITYQDVPPSPKAVARGAMRRVGRTLGGTSVGAYFPSEVGLAPVDRTHVAGDHSAKVLGDRGSRARQVLASGLPRWPDPESDTPARVLSVVYLTGAFRWHDDTDTADAQMRDVAELADACTAIGLALTIRVHPRDDVEAYLGVSAAILDPRTESMTATIRRSDLILSTVSTGLIEGVILGRPTRVLAINPRWSRYRRAFVADPIFGAIRDGVRLRETLRQLMAGIDPTDVARQRLGLHRYVAATGQEATRRIAATIGEQGRRR